jgi:hypothetical protein
MADYSRTYTKEVKTSGDLLIKADSDVSISAASELRLSSNSTGALSLLELRAPYAYYAAIERPSGSNLSFASTGVNGTLIIGTDKTITVPTGYGSQMIMELEITAEMVLNAIGICGLILAVDDSIVFEQYQETTTGVDRHPISLRYSKLVNAGQSYDVESRGYCSVASAALIIPRRWQATYKLVPVPPTGGFTEV